MSIDDVRRIDLGAFGGPPRRPAPGGRGVEAVYRYVVRTASGVLLLDTGLGDAGDGHTLYAHTGRAIRRAGA